MRMLRRDKLIRYMRLAWFVAREFSKDPSTQVGAVLLEPTSYSVLALGYNGMPRGVDETRRERFDRPAKYLFFEHAERNAIFNAARFGTPLQGCIAVVTLMPCMDCARALVQVGAAAVVTMRFDEAHDRWGAHFAQSRALLAELEIPLIQLEPEDVGLPGPSEQNGTESQR